MKNLLIAGGVVAIVAIAIGAYFFPAQSLFQGTAGNTFSNAKVAAININPQSITSTSTSLYNSDSTDRTITDAFVTCTGLTTMYGSGPQSTGVDAFRWYMATSSVAAPTASVANAVLGAANFTLGTSTAFNYAATSTYTVPWGRIWTAGTYMIFQTNATSSSAACTAGVHYLAQ